MEIFNYGTDGKKHGQGSGFFVSRYGYVATNLHVVVDAADVSIKTNDGKEYRIDRVINTDVESDLVLFSLKGLSSSRNYLAFTDGKAEVGDDILAIGNPMGLELTASNGIVSAVRDLPDYGQVYQITAPVSPGSSGGPVINTGGYVVGVVTMGYKEGQNLNFIVPGYKVLALVNSSARRPMDFVSWRKNGVGYMPSTSDGLLRLGFIYYNSGEFKKALDCAGMIMKKDKKFAKGWFLAGKSAYEAGNIDYAFKAMKYAYTLEPDMESVHNDLGVMYRKSNMSAEATEEYFLEMEKHPDNPDPYYNLAGIYEESGSVDDAIEILKQGIVKCEDTSLLHSRLGFMFIRLVDVPSAELEFSTAIKLDKSNSDAYYGLGSAFMKEGKKEEAIKIYNKLKEIDKKAAEKLFYEIYS